MRRQHANLGSIVEAGVDDIVGPHDRAGCRPERQHSVQASNLLRACCIWGVPDLLTGLQGHAVNPAKAIGEDNRAVHHRLHLVEGHVDSTLGLVHHVVDPQDAPISDVDCTNSLAHESWNSVHRQPWILGEVVFGVAGQDQPAPIDNWRVRVTDSVLGHPPTPDLLPSCRIPSICEATLPHGVDAAVPHRDVAQVGVVGVRAPAEVAPAAHRVHPAGGARNVHVELAVDHGRGVEGLQGVHVAFCVPVWLFEGP
mmetsp:Transcript_1388/g.4057  ORF Transcript_1388/g.4057 Transcript_1388/m.4057 type:complete len:254 (-) Transcript_1388:298-1059(-)